MARFGAFGSGRRIVVAVSGGADSVALALLLSRWGNPLAAIVDHGLRAESAAEASSTVGRLEALGIQSVVLRADLSAGPALAERARAARYRLLFDVCRERGLPDLLVAHHAADQAETVRMRLDGASGPAGLSGMAPLGFHPQARLLRPLLSIDPARLRATLRQAQVRWVEDPSNPATARGRLRASASDADRAAMLALAACQGSQRAMLEQDAAAELAQVRLSPEGFAVVDSALGPAALSALIWTIAGRSHPPPRARLVAGLSPRTVCGVVLRPAGRLGQGILVTREPAAVAGAIPAHDGAVWDGRFRLVGTVPQECTIGALGSEAARFRSHSSLPSVVLSCLPVLRRRDDICAVPHLGFPDTATCRSVRFEFRPARPVVPAPFGCGAVNPSESRGVQSVFGDLMLVNKAAGISAANGTGLSDAHDEQFRP